MIQAIGSTVTYLERYTLLAVTGLAVAGTDTDGTSRPSLDEVVCPTCNFAGAFIVGKPEYGGGLCASRRKADAERNSRNSLARLFLEMDRSRQKRSPRSSPAQSLTPSASTQETIRCSY